MSSRRKLWPTTKLGARVIVARSELAPADFAHAKLFAPRPKPVADPVAKLDRPIRLAQNDAAPQDGATMTDARPVDSNAVAPVAADEKRPEEAAKPAETAETAAEAGGRERRGHRGEAGGSGANR